MGRPNGSPSSELGATVNSKLLSMPPSVSNAVHVPVSSVSIAAKLERRTDVVELLKTIPVGEINRPLVIGPASSDRPESRAVSE